MNSRISHFGLIVGALLSLSSPGARAGACMEDFGKQSCIRQTFTPGVYLIEINGPIEMSLVEDVKSVVKNGGRINTLEVSQSPGGDAEAAMALGRLLRAKEVDASVNGDCASACVFAIAGATFRTYYKARIGLHRPYFTSASSSPAEASQRVRAMNASMRAYFEEMNVSPALLDAMTAIPSDQIRWITPAEVNHLGLLDIDPAYEEYSDGKQAAKLGISRAEYLGRKAEFKSQCQAKFSYLQPEFCACVDRVKFRAPGDKWGCDYIKAQ